MNEKRYTRPFNPVLTPKTEKEAPSPITFSPCIVCGKKIGDGYYGRWGDGGACSKTCDTIQETKPRYPLHKE